MDRLIRSCFNYLGNVINDRHLLEVLHSSVITFLLRLISFLLIYLLHFMIATIYGPAELGIFNLALTIIEIGLVISMLGIDTAAIRFLAEYYSQHQYRLAQNMYDHILKLTTITSVSCSLLLFSFADWLASSVFHQQALTIHIKIVAVVLPFMVISRIQASAFRAIKKLVRTIIYEVIVIRVVHVVGLLIMVVLFGPSEIQVIYVFAVAIVASALIGLFDWRKEVRKTTSEAAGRTDRDERIKEAVKYKQLLSVSLPMFFTSSMTLIMGWTDIIMLGIYFAPEVVGIYSVVLKLSVLTGFAFASINSIILPKFSELYWKNDISALRKVLQFSNRILFWASAPMLILIACLAEYLLSIFGHQFTLGSISLIILCLGQFTSCATGNVIALLNMTGHQNKAKDALLISAAINIIGNFLLIPFYGMIGAAVATSLGMMTRDVIASYFSYRVFGFKTWYVPWDRQRVQTG